MKTIKIIFIMAIMIAISAGNIFGADDITIYVNGSLVESQNEPVIKNNTTLVPMRDVAEAMGADVNWDSELKQINIRLNNILIAMTIGNLDISKFPINNSEGSVDLDYANVKIITSSVAPQIINGSTYIPLRIVAEALDAEVEWDGETKTINITSSVSDADSGSITYTLDNNVLTISGNGAMKDYDDDSSLMSEYNNVKKIVIKEGITHIGDYAFYGLVSDELESVEIPNSVVSIGERAFFGCSGLTSIEIPEGVETIGTTAFGFCENLKSAKIPSTVSDIGRLHPFYACSKLESIDVDSGNANYSSIDGILYNKKITELINCPEAKTSVKIPTTVTDIGSCAFYECANLKEIIIPNGVINIGPNAFNDCDNLTSIELPNSVVSIGAHAFMHCDNLTSVLIPSSVTKINESAFSLCKNITQVKCKKGSVADDVKLYDDSEVEFVYY